MRERIRLILAALFYYCGLTKLAVWWKQHTGQHLIILNYHEAKGENLRHQLLYLRHHYRIMHLEEALEEFYASPEEQRRRRKGDRRTPLVLTFDDGYLDNYTYGLQLARELQVPFTVFLIPGYTESGACFWWLAADYLVNHTTLDKVTIEGQTYHLAQPAERNALAQAITTHVRNASTVAQREAFLADIQQALAVSLPTRAVEDLNDLSLPVTWEEIREMEQSGWVSFGAHTMHHPILAYLSDPIEAQYELVECRRVLEQQLGHPIRTFAYPVGKLRHIGDQGLKAVKVAGYQWALTTIEEVNTPQTDPHQLNRLPGDIALNWMVMAAELAGLLGILSRLRKKA
ncbi:MAG: polysaccharide deacetylase family protein [Chloroflexi bacterium]|nr:polysaccharide deacetylase family protein [Chloroflexota bacterium]